MRKIISLLIPFGLVAACDREPEPEAVGVRAPASDPLPRDVDVDVDGEDVDLSDERQRLTRWVDERVDEIDAEIQELERRGGEEAAETVALLRAKRDQLLGKMGELRERTARNWEAFEEDMKRGWTELSREVDQAL